MPVFFQLISRETNAPATFIEIDERICRELLCEEPHKRKYARDWVSVIGLYLALGKTLSQVHEELEDPEMKRICAWLNDFYTARSWRGSKI